MQFYINVIETFREFNKMINVTLFFLELEYKTITY